MKNTHPSSIQKICIASLLLATGIILPELFHIIGGSAMGGLFLPMHIPVFIAGLLLGRFYGTVVGAVTPIISFLLTGMPPAVILPFMILELISYGFLSGFMQSKNCNLYLSIIVAQIGGRAVNAAALLVAAYLLHLNVAPVMAVGTAVVLGIPGIVIQLFFVPMIVLLVRRVMHVDKFAES